VAHVGSEPELGSETLEGRLELPNRDLNHVPAALADEMMVILV
jgi:hypothetical protein